MDQSKHGIANLKQINIFIGTNSTSNTYRTMSEVKMTEALHHRVIGVGRGKKWGGTIPPRSPASKKIKIYSQDPFRNNNNAGMIATQ